MRIAIKPLPGHGWDRDVRKKPVFYCAETIGMEDARPVPKIGYIGK